MLSTLHHAASYIHPWYKFWKKNIIPRFEFEIIHKDNRIRFFMHSPEAYAGFLESQLYAHYPDIEISRTEVPIAPHLPLLSQQAELKENNNKTIKLYGGLKDKTERESIDPISSITSALAKVPKDEIALFHISFCPKKDAWRK